MSLGKKARFKGAICAESIEVKKGATVLHHSSLTPLPKLSPEDDEDDIEEEKLTSIPTEFELGQNYPNSAICILRFLDDFVARKDKS